MKPIVTRNFNFSNRTNQYQNFSQNFEGKIKHRNYREIFHDSVNFPLEILRDETRPVVTENDVCEQRDDQKLSTFWNFRTMTILMSDVKI